MNIEIMALTSLMTPSCFAGALPAVPAPCYLHVRLVVVCPHRRMSNMVKNGLKVVKWIQVELKLVE